MSWEKPLIALLAPIVVLSQQAVDRRLGGFRAQHETLYLWSGEQIKRLAPGFEDILADVYWLRTVQYFGGQRAYAEGKSFELLHPLVDITTTLDPRLGIAYKYGAIFLAEPRPIGAGDARGGIALLEKGVAANPLDWRLRQDLGFFHFLYLDDGAAAARILNEAAEIAGAPYWLRTLAAQLAAQGGERDAARSMWQVMAAQSEDGPIKENARMNLNILAALDGRDFLQARVDQFELTMGRRPSSLDDLVRERVVRSVPVDPSGTSYEYDAGTGRVHVAHDSKLYRSQYERR